MSPFGLHMRSTPLRNGLRQGNVVDEETLGNRKSENGAPATAAAVKSRQQFFMMRRSGAIRRPLAKSFEYFLEFRCPRNDHASVDGPKLEKESKIIQITIEEWVFVVPFDLDGYPSFEAVDGMRRAIDARLIH